MPNGELPNFTPQPGSYEWYQPGNPGFTAMPGGGATHYLKIIGPTGSPPQSIPAANPFQNLDLQSLTRNVSRPNSYQNWLSSITGNNSLDSISNLVKQMNSPSLTKGFGGMTHAPTYDWGFQW